MQAGIATVGRELTLPHIPEEIVGQGGWRSQEDHPDQEGDQKDPVEGQRRSGQGEHPRSPDQQHGHDLECVVAEIAQEDDTAGRKDRPDDGWHAIALRDWAMSWG